MPAYLLIQLKIQTPEMYKIYVQNVKAIIEHYGGEYIVRGGKISSFIGNWTPDRVVLIKFLSRAQIERCFQSEEYKKLAPYRENATESSAIIIETPD